MKPIEVSSIEEWLEYFRAEAPVLTFKHSTRCGISSMAWQRMQRGWRDGIQVQVLYVDLIAHRDLSDAISQHTGIPHASPQMILSRQGEILGHASHMEIRADLVLEWLEKCTMA